MIEEDKYGRAVPALTLEVHDPGTEDDREVEKLLTEFLLQVGRSPADLRVYRLPANGKERRLPWLDASGVAYEGLDAIVNEFIPTECRRHRSWIETFPEKSKLPVFGHPYSK